MLKQASRVIRIRNLFVLIVMGFVASCATPNISSAQESEPPFTREQRAKNAEVFVKRGKYEKEASFIRRRDAAIRAEKFFSDLSVQNCLIKIDEENICFRVSGGIKLRNSSKAELSVNSQSVLSEGIVEIYNQGVFESRDWWYRSNDRICIDKHCHTPTSFKTQSYAEHVKQMGASQDDTLDDVETLRNKRIERVELVVKSALCFRCKNGAWPRSMILLDAKLPQCTSNLNSHMDMHGALGINNGQFGISESDQEYGFLFALEEPAPIENSVIDLKSLSVNRAEICEPELIWDFGIK